MAIDDELNENEKRLHDAQDRLDQLLTWYRNKADSFKDKGWIVYYRTENWGEDNPGYDRKMMEWGRMHPEISARGTDFWLCTGDGDIKGFSEARIGDKNWNEQAQRRISRIRKMLQAVDVFCFVDDDHYETYIAGEFYALLNEPLTPDEAANTAVKRKIRRGFEDLLEMKDSM